jgi:hypothetical protein
VPINANKADRLRSNGNVCPNISKPVFEANGANVTTTARVPEVSGKRKVISLVDSGDVVVSAHLSGHIADGLGELKFVLE